MSSSVQYWEGAALGKHAAALAEHISSPAAFDVLTSDDLDEIADLINLPADAREKLHECLTAASRRSLPPPPDEAEAQALQDLRSAQTALEHAESNMAGAAKAISHRAMMERTRAALDAAEARALASIDAAEASLNGVLSNAVRRVWNGETASDPLSWQLCLADDTLRPSRRDLASSKIAASCARELRSLVDAHSDTSPSIKLAFSDAVVVESLGKVTVAPARTAPVLQLRAQDLLRILSYATPANPRRSAAFLGLLSAVCFKFHSQTVSIGRLSDDPLSIAAAAACAGVEDAPPSAVVAQAALAHSASSALTSAWWRTGVAALRINARRPVAARARPSVVRGAAVIPSGDGTRALARVEGAASSRLLFSSAPATGGGWRDGVHRWTVAWSGASEGRSVGVASVPLAATLTWCPDGSVTQSGLHDEAKMELLWPTTAATLTLELDFDHGPFVNRGEALAELRERTTTPIGASSDRRGLSLRGGPFALRASRKSITIRVGRRVRISWAGNKKYCGSIIACHPDETKKFRVHYDDGDKREYHAFDSKNSTVIPLAKKSSKETEIEFLNDDGTIDTSASSGAPKAAAPPLQARRSVFALATGDSVRVRESVARPLHGWGAVEAGDVGIVVDTTTSCELVIDFPKHRGWRGIEVEMERTAEVETEEEEEEEEQGGGGGAGAGADDDGVSADIAEGLAGAFGAASAARLIAPASPPPASSFSFGGAASSKPPATPTKSASSFSFECPPPVPPPPPPPPASWGGDGVYRSQPYTSFGGAVSSKPPAAPTSVFGAKPASSFSFGGAASSKPPAAPTNVFGAASSFSFGGAAPSKPGFAAPTSGFPRSAYLANSGSSALPISEISVPSTPPPRLRGPPPRSATSKGSSTEGTVFSGRGLKGAAAGLPTEVSEAEALVAWEEAGLEWDDIAKVTFVSLVLPSSGHRGGLDRVALDDWLEAIAAACGVEGGAAAADAAAAAAPQLEQTTINDDAVDHGGDLVRVPMLRLRVDAHAPAARALLQEAEAPQSRDGAHGLNTPRAAPPSSGPESEWIEVPLIAWALSNGCALRPFHHDSREVSPSDVGHLPSKLPKQPIHSPMVCEEYTLAVPAAKAPTPDRVAIAVETARREESKQRTSAVVVELALAEAAARGGCVNANPSTVLHAMDRIHTQVVAVRKLKLSARLRLQRQLATAATVTAEKHKQATRVVAKARKTLRLLDEDALACVVWRRAFAVCPRRGVGGEPLCFNSRDCHSNILIAQKKTTDDIDQAQRITHLHVGGANFLCRTDRPIAIVGAGGLPAYFEILVEKYDGGGNGYNALGLATRSCSMKIAASKREIPDTVRRRFFSSLLHSWWLCAASLTNFSLLPQPHIFLATFFTLVSSGACAQATAAERGDPDHSSRSSSTKQTSAMQTAPASGSASSPAHVQSRGSGSRRPITLRPKRM